MECPLVKAQKAGRQYLSRWKGPTILKRDQLVLSGVTPKNMTLFKLWRLTKEQIHFSALLPEAQFTR